MKVDGDGDGLIDFDELKMWGIERVGIRGDLGAYIRRFPTLDEGLQSYIEAVISFQEVEVPPEGLQVANVKEYSMHLGTASSLVEVHSGHSRTLSLTLMSHVRCNASSKTSRVVDPRKSRRR